MQCPGCFTNGKETQCILYRRLGVENLTPTRVCTLNLPVCCVAVFNSICSCARIVSWAVSNSSEFNDRIKYLTGMYKRDAFTVSVQRVSR